VDRPGSALRLWGDSGALAVLIPSLGAMTDVALATLDLLPRATPSRHAPQRTANRLAALFLDVPITQARLALADLRLSKHQTNWVIALAERWQGIGREMSAALSSGTPTDPQVRRWLARLGRLHAGAFLRVASARWHAERSTGGTAPSAAAVRALHRRMRRSLYTDPIQVADLRIGGDDLRRLGIPAGPIYAKILQALLERVLEDPARNTPDALLAEVPRLVAAAGGDAGTAAHLSTEQ
jgi:tRNA nucleotidyltransferase (CCA-adding enzyme)